MPFEPGAYVYRRTASGLCLEVHVGPTLRLRTRRGLSDRRYIGRDNPDSGSRRGLVTPPRQV
jgi:hypothetical protein